MASPTEKEIEQDNDDTNGDGEGRDYDPTPWCHQCGARTKVTCDCGPRADND